MRERGAVDMTMPPMRGQLEPKAGGLQCYNKLMACAAALGDHREALHLYELLKKDGIRPSK